MEPENIPASATQVPDHDAVVSPKTATIMDHHGSPRLSPLRERARRRNAPIVPSDTLLKQYVSRRAARLFTRSEKKKDMNMSRIASQEETAFYTVERAKMAQRLEECEKESMELEVAVLDIHSSIETVQATMLDALEEQQKLEAVLRDLSQRELTCEEERILIEDEFFSRLGTGLPCWPAEMRTAARDFVHSIKRAVRHHNGEEDFGQVRAYAQWLGRMASRGPRREVVPGERCVAQERIDALRAAFLRR